MEVVDLKQKIQMSLICLTSLTNRIMKLKNNPVLLFLLIVFLSCQFTTLLHQAAAQIDVRAWDTVIESKKHRSESRVCFRQCWVLSFIISALPKIHGTIQYGQKLKLMNSWPPCADTGIMCQNWKPFQRADLTENLAKQVCK